MSNRKTTRKASENPDSLTAFFVSAMPLEATNARCKWEKDYRKQTYVREEGNEIRLTTQWDLQMRKQACVSHIGKELFQGQRKHSKQCRKNQPFSQQASRLA